MSGKRKPRVPRVIRDPIAWALSGAQAFRATGDAAAIVNNRNHGALHALVRGQATRDDLQTVTGIYNMLIALSEQGFAKEFEDEFEAMGEAIEAFVKRPNHVLKADEIRLVNRMMELHDAQLDVVSVSEVDRANKLIAGRRGSRTGVFL